jgi:hypothetical protein
MCWQLRAGTVQKKEDAMRLRMILAVLFVAAATAAVGPASAQDAQRGGIRTETQDRLAGRDSGTDILWNALGLVGLLGLLGLRGDHADDSYHPSSVD